MKSYGEVSDILLPGGAFRGIYYNSAQGEQEHTDKLKKKIQKQYNHMTNIMVKRSRLDDTV